MQNRVQLAGFFDTLLETWRKRQSRVMYDRRSEVINLLTTSIHDHVHVEWQLKVQCDETPFPCFNAALEAQWHATRQCEMHFAPCMRATTVAALPDRVELTREKTEHRKRVAQGNSERNVDVINRFIILPHALALHNRYLAAIMNYTNLITIVYVVEAITPTMSDALRALCDEIYGKWLHLRHAKRTQEDVVGAIDDVSRFIEKLRELFYSS